MSNSDLGVCTDEYIDDVQDDYIIQDEYKMITSLFSLFLKCLQC